MGRALKAKLATRDTALPVTLAEAEFDKLTRLSQAVTLAAHDAGAALMRAKQAVAEREAARNAYMDTLTAKYPDLDFQGVVYDGDEATFTLTPKQPAPG